MSFFRAKHARPQVILSEESEALITELQDDSADTSLLAESRLSREELTKALETLPQSYRDALTLRFFENRSYAEMSDILQVPVGTVSTLLYRAKRSLRGTLPKTFSS
jgi:RNA polymerase sigma-70 factor (ECF subfamily)